MPQRLRILAPTRYQWTFHGPCASRHGIERRHFLPLNYISSKVEGITALNPFPLRRFDLIHAHNRIPVSTLPFVIGFESHLPRGFGLEKTTYFRMLTARLAGSRCRAIVAMSECAKRTFLLVHQDSPHRDTLAAKLHVRLPSIYLPPDPDRLRTADLPIRVCFVGNHFARKGGCVAVVLARLARQAGFPLHVDIVSNLQVGGSIWTDPTDARFFEPYFAALAQPNVTLHTNLANRAVLALLARSHLCLLTTLSDTFGFSAIEAMAHHTPVLATRQGALPEFITHGLDGILLDMPVKDNGEWVHVGTRPRDSAAYAALVRDEIDRLAAEPFAAIVALRARPGALAAMRARCRQTAAARFSKEAANAYWDDLYEQAVRGVVEETPLRPRLRAEREGPVAKQREGEVGGAATTS